MNCKRILKQVIKLKSIRLPMSKRAIGTPIWPSFSTYKYKTISYFVKVLGHWPAVTFRSFCSHTCTQWHCGFYVLYKGTVIWTASGSETSSKTLINPSPYVIQFEKQSAKEFRRLMRKLVYVYMNSSCKCNMMTGFFLLW